MEKLETVIEHLKQQSSSQWNKTENEKEYYVLDVEERDVVSVEYGTLMESRDYRLTRSRDLKKILRFEIASDPKRQSIMFYDPKEDKEVLLTNENAVWGIPLWEQQNGRQFPTDKVLAFRFKYVPDHETTRYHLTITRTVSDNGTTISEHLEYRNDQLLSELFDMIDKNYGKNAL